MYFDSFCFFFHDTFIPHLLLYSIRVCCVTNICIQYVNVCVSVYLTEVCIKVKNIQNKYLKKKKHNSNNNNNNTQTHLCESAHHEFISNSQQINVILYCTTTTCALSLYLSLSNKFAIFIMEICELLKYSIESKYTK